MKQRSTGSSLNIRGIRVIRGYLLAAADAMAEVLSVVFRNDARAQPVPQFSSVA